MEENRRRDKLDDALLFVMGSVGILFGLIQVFVGFSTYFLQIILPVGLLGWVLPFYYGYVRGAVRDSIADRYRGWIFLVVGLTLYAVVVAMEELSRFVPNPGLEWTVPVAFSPVLFLFVFRLGYLRRFVLGPTFTRNEVLSRSAHDAAAVAGVIAFAGAFFSIAKFQTVDSLILAAPLVVVAIVPAAIFLRRSNDYASKINWKYSLVEKKRRLHGHRKVELANKTLRVLAYATGITGAALASLAVYLGDDPALLVPISEFLLGWAFLLLIPAMILNFFTGSTQEIVFDKHGP